MTHEQIVFGMVAVFFLRTLAFGVEPERVDAYGDPLPPGAVLRLGTVRFRHAGISDFAASADGSVLATVASSRPQIQFRDDARYSVRIWDGKTGHRLFEIDNTGSDVALSPDGRLLAVPAGLWNARSGGTIVGFDPPGRVAEVVGTEFSADGSRLLVARWQSLFTWDVARTAKLADLKTERGARLSSVAISTDGKLFATVTVEREHPYTPTIELWKTDTCELVRKFSRPQACTSLSFSPDAQTLSGSGGLLWDVESGDFLYPLDGERGDSALVFWPTGHVPAAASANGQQVTFWDVDRARVLSSMKAQAGRVQLVHDGKHLLTASGGALRFLDPATGEELSDFAGHHASVTDICLTPDGRSIVSASADATVRIWDAQDGTERRTLRGPITQWRCLSISPDGRFAAAGEDTDAGLIAVWELESGRLCWQTLYTHPRNLAFSADSRQLLAFDIEGHLRTWDAASGSKLPSIQLMDRGYHKYAFSPDTRLIAIAREDGLAIFAVDSGAKLASAEIVGWATAVTFSPGGKRLAVSSHESDDGHGQPVDRRAVVQCFDVASGKRTQFIDAYKGEITEIAFSPDGGHLAAADYNHAIRVWNVKNGQEVRRFKSGPHVVKAIAFSADGKRLVTGGDGATLLVWELEDVK